MARPWKVNEVGRGRGRGKTEPERARHAAGAEGRDTEGKWFGEGPGHAVSPGHRGLEANRAGSRTKTESESSVWGCRRIGLVCYQVLGVSQPV